MLAPATALGGELEILVDNIDSREGRLMVAVFDDSDDFPASQQRVAQAMVPAAPGGSRLVISGLVEGRYAVAVNHDRNGNGAQDRNLIGVPSEPYGFSNDARGFAGPPSFEAAAFEVKGPRTTVRIALTQ